MKEKVAEKLGLGDRKYRGTIKTHPPLAHAYSKKQMGGKSLFGRECSFVFLPAGFKALEEPTESF